MPSTPAAVRKQIAAGTADPVYLLQGEDDVEKSALAHEFAELVDEGLRAFNVERIHAGDLTTGDRLADGVGVAGRRGPHAADDGRRAASSSCCRPRRCWRRSARARRRRGRSTQLEALLQAARAADDARAGRGARSTSAAGCSSCCRSRRRSSSAARSRIWRTPSAGSGRASRPPARQIDPAAARLLAAARRHRTSSGCAATSIGCCSTRWARSTITRRRCAGDGRAGGAAGRLGDDQRDRGRADGARRCVSWR